jgi:hypothetical protein
MWIVSYRKGGVDSLKGGFQQAKVHKSPVDLGCMIEMSILNSEQIYTL